MTTQIEHPQTHIKSVVFGENQIMVNPIVWRDRVREIDNTFKILHDERLELIQKLKDEGFTLTLIDDDVTQPDITLWKDLRSGDCIKCIDDSEWNDVTCGKVYSIKIESGMLWFKDDTNEIRKWEFDWDNMDDFWKDFVFHSRPTV